MKAPGELAGAIAGASRLPGSGNDLASRMQAADDAIVILTVYGTGRTMGGAVRSDTIGDRLEGIAVTDREGLGDGRMAYLAGVLTPFALVRLGAGFLLALAPLMAGLLLFSGTRDLFMGWLRGLGALALGSAALSILQGVQLAILEPWLRDALALRSAQLLTPSAPTELSVITSVFMLVSFALLFVIGKIFFFGGMGVSGVWQQFQTATGRSIARAPAAALAITERGTSPRAVLIAEGVSQTLRREGAGAGFDRMPGSLSLNRPDGRAALVAAGGTRVEGLGEHLRLPEARRFRRGSEAGRKRDMR